MGISNIIALLSGVALFLFGMQLMGEGLKSVAGSKLELILYKLSSTPLKGVLLGTGVTAVIQSSSATSVMVVGFVNSGMMKTRQAIGVVLGAILGTSITGWVICLSDVGGSGIAALFSTAVLTGVVAVIGIILRMFCKSAVKHHLGDILLGFAVLMFGMSAMSDAVAPLRDEPAFVELLTKFSNPFLGILVGCLITCVLQSASAAVGILQALAVTGVRFDTALPLIMGIAVGAAVPVLLSALGANLAGKRTAFVYLLIDMIGVAFWAIVFYTANAIFRFPFMDEPMTTVTIAALNTTFRLATVLLLTPATGLLEKLVEFLIRGDDEDESEMADIDRLEERFIPHPAIAIEQSRLAISSMAEKAAKNLYRSVGLIENWQPDKYNKVQKKEEVIDRYEDKLGTYLVKITRNELNGDENREVSKFLHTISDFERISDHAVNISNVAREINQKKMVFSKVAEQELVNLGNAVKEIVNITLEAFRTENIEKSYDVEPLEECIDDLCDELKLHHINRISSGECTLDHGFVFNDLLTNFERVADHCSNVAVAMIELQADEFDTHEYLNTLKQDRGHRFDERFEAFKKKYSLNP